MTKLTRQIHRIGFQLKKHSPEILVVAGVIGTVASAVVACKATTKLNEVLESDKKQIEEINGYVEETGYSEKYTEDMHQKDIVHVHAKTGVEIAKLYAPAVTLGVVSITSILAGHNICRKRNAALAAAYTITNQGFKEYRNRVVERFGEELDRELKYNLKTKEIEETIINDKGEEETVKKTVQVMDPNRYSDYARFFDDGCLGWEKNAEYNLLFLKQQQNYANEILRTRGHLFLNEVYDMLGIPRTQAGQIVGWVYDEKNPVGDNFVDFGIYDLYNERARDFVNGYERSILLDFNVDGDIWQLMR